MEIQELISHINHEPEAFSEIISEYEGKLMRYILRISNMEYEEAENLLQDVFIKVYRSINEYDARWSFSSWVYRITHNAVTDYSRSGRYRHRNVSLDDAEYVHLVNTLSDRSSPDKDLLDSDIRECVNKVITMLPENYREAIVLRYLEEKTYEEISDILRIPVGTASTLVNRAKRRMYETFEKLRCVP